MIAETAVLSTSPWQSDFLRDLPKLTSPGGLLNFDFDLPDADFDKHANDDFDRFCSEFGSECSGTSVASSVCSDETGADPEFDLFPTDQLSAFLGSMTSEAVTVEALPEASLWSDTTLQPTGASPLMELDTDDIRESLASPAHNNNNNIIDRKRSLSESSYESDRGTQPWSQVCSREQVLMIQELTNVISTQMGLREQLEVIKIINPEANISPTDSEFVIDLNCLNDEKLQLIKEYVHKTVKSNKTATASSNSSSSSSSHKNNNNYDNSSCCSSVESSSECSSPPQKRASKKQRRQERKEARLRQRKEYRQMMKEKRSGLFKKEEVLSVSKTTSKNVEEEEEDIEIDIL